MKSGMQTMAFVILYCFSYSVFFLFLFNMTYGSRSVFFQIPAMFRFVKRILGKIYRPTKYFCRLMDCEHVEHCNLAWLDWIE